MNKMREIILYAICIKSFHDPFIFINPSRFFYEGHLFILDTFHRKHGMKGRGIVITKRAYHVIPLCITRKPPLVTKQRTHYRRGGCVDVKALDINDGASTTGASDINLHQIASRPAAYILRIRNIISVNKISAVF